METALAGTQVLTVEAGEEALRLGRQHPPARQDGGVEWFGIVGQVAHSACPHLKVAQRLEHPWRPLNGGLTVMTLLLGGARFVDGVYLPEAREVSAA